MGNSDVNTYIVDQCLEILLEEVMTTAVTATTVTNHQDFGGIRVIILTLSLPPCLETFTGKLRCISTGSEIDESFIACEIINRMRNNDAGGHAVKVMI